MYIDERGDTPLVSVIMPAYNAEAFIEEAICSVINQTEENWELFVIDDCSRDNSFQIATACSAKDSRIHVLQNDVNLGVAKTRNRGIELAQGKYIAFLDSDDVWCAEKIERQIKKIEQFDAGISYCSYAIIDKEGNRARADYFVPEQVTWNDLLIENCIQCSAMLIRSDIVKRIMFKTEFYHEDYILGLDILKQGHKAVGCSEILLDWRYIENSRSFNKKKSARNRWKIYREYLKLSLVKSLVVFVGYAYAGLRKYSRRYRE